MGVKDFLSPPKTINSTLVYDQKELYRYLQKWLSERGYDVAELDYTEKILADGKKLYAFNWICDKRVDDYTKFMVSIDFKAEAENVQIELQDEKKKTAQKGTVTIKIATYIEKDIEAEWSLKKEAPYRALMREIYDKMVTKGKWARYTNKLAKDANLLISDIKTYLKTHRYD
ncbi:MAG: hypothetical protein QT08_C0021G0020 [archaeon GW2011_AR17]|nr:MAG: hypothetical protein QT08_C0021G0020 [archaeon GW2011_AR17]HIH14966.1 hypothetical protein [Nanoarchaeota archaeon]HIH58384.1 hypothetical protein [Nanoarchaeota archaeon]HII14099.1 hypothetical protein [Nanoarchaeota archaeon]HIJ04739.1 hypothetical protein [Nanoarchaeota archaeon]